MNEYIISEWIIVGDQSVRVLLDWLTPEKIPPTEGAPVYCTYDSAFSCAKQNGTWQIKTPKIIPHMSIWLLSKSQDTANIPHTSKAKFAVCEGFPFGKDSTRELYFQILQQTKEEFALSPSVVLLRIEEKIRFGSTDIGSENLDRNLFESSDEMQVPMLRLKEEKDVLQLFRWNESTLDYWKRQGQMRLKSLRERIDAAKYDFFECMNQWDEPDGILGVATIDEITNYEVLRRYFTVSAISIWEIYMQRAEKKLFEKNCCNLTEIGLIYQDILEDCFPELPDIQQEAAMLVDEIQTELKAVLQREKCGEKKFPQDFFEYNMYLNETHIVSKFSQALQKFAKEDAQIILQNKLEQKYRDLQEVF